MFISKPILLGLIVVVIVLGVWLARNGVEQNDTQGLSSPVASESTANQAKPLYRPDFKLPDLEGNMRDVNEWDGKVLVVNFWATWCPPCKREIPVFIELQERYATKGVQFVGIALDETDVVQDLVDTFGIEYPILLGGEAAIAASKAYGNRFGALPFTAVIDRTGHIVSTFRGELKKTVAETLLKRLL